MTKEEIRKITKNKSVLFVDDDMLVLDTMRDILSELFKESFFAENGQIGLETFQKTPTDIIITDITMPHLTGIEMINSILDSRESNIDVIFITGHNQDDLADEVDLNSIFYITKPISTKKLYDTFDKIFSQNL